MPDSLKVTRGRWPIADDGEYVQVIQLDI